MRKIKTLEININLYTDGDFSPRDNMCFDWDGYEGYTTSETFTNDEHGRAEQKARAWLDELAVSWSITPSHQWLVKDLHEIVSGMREFIVDENSTELTYCRTMCGNYDGTEFEVRITELEEPISIKDWPATIESAYRRVMEDECDSDGVVSFKLWWGWNFDTKCEECVGYIDGVRGLDIEEGEQVHRISLSVNPVHATKPWDGTMADVMKANPKDIRLVVSYLNPADETITPLAVYQVTGFYESDYVNSTVTVYAKEVKSE